MGTIVPTHKLSRITSNVLIVALVVSQFSVAWAGHRGGRSSAVGGISIDVSGVVGPPSRDGLKLHLAELRKEIKATPDDMVMPVKMRIVSLRGLAASCEDAMKNRSVPCPKKFDSWLACKESNTFLSTRKRMTFCLPVPPKVGGSTSTRMSSA